MGYSYYQLVYGAFSCLYAVNSFYCTSLVYNDKNGIIADVYDQLKKISVFHKKKKNNVQVWKKNNIPTQLK